MLYHFEKEFSGASDPQTFFDFRHRLGSTRVRNEGFNCIELPALESGEHVCRVMSCGELRQPMYSEVLAGQTVSVSGVTLQTGPLAKYCPA